jgi:hypothetical protein
MDQEREDYGDEPAPEGHDLLTTPLFWLAVSPLALFVLAASGAVAWVLVRH